MTCGIKIKQNGNKKYFIKFWKARIAFYENNIKILKRMIAIEQSKKKIEKKKTPPKTSDDYGEEGWMSYDDAFHYIYVNGQWLRQPIADFEF